ncbi:MAG: acyl-CoA carboxylase epsilon subunit [Ornithinibacter sp.]
MTSSQAQSSSGPGPVTGDGEAAAPGAVPGVRITGPATAQDVAAIIAVLAAASGGSEDADTDAGSSWASHAAAMRRPVGHGPGAWRTSLRP